MNPSAEEDLLLELAIEHAKEHGEWPKLEVLHRRIHQGSDLSIKTLDVAKRLAPKPFLGGGYTWLGETFAPPPNLIARVGEGRRLLGSVVSWINLALAKYRAASGQPEITTAEFVEETGADEATARPVRLLLGWFSETTNGSQWNEQGWTITVGDEIVNWPLLASVDDLLAEWSRRQQRSEQLGAVADDGKHRLVMATRRDPSAPVLEPHASSWTDSQWARTALWIAGIIGGFAALTSIGVLLWRMLD